MVERLRGKWWLAAGAVIVLAVAAGALSVLWRGPSKQPAPPPAAPAEFTEPEVSLPGLIRAQHVILLGVPVDGIIEFTAVEPGQDVYEGEVLAHVRNQGLEAAQQLAQAQVERAQTRLDSLNSAVIAARLEASRARADASRAQTEFERADKAYQRQQILNKEGAARRLEFEKAQKEFQLAEGQYRALEELARYSERRVVSLGKEIDAARRLLEDKNRELEEAQQDNAAAEIRSPVDGILLARSMQHGDEVTRDIKDLFQIATDLSLLEAVIEPTPPLRARLRPGQAALVVIAEAPGEGLQGAVREVKPGEAIVEFVSPTTAIRPGLTAQVTIRLR